MARKQDQLAELQEIRNLMERSARFTSLSGMSGIVVGVLALGGVGAVHWHISNQGVTYQDVYKGTLPALTGTFLLTVAGVVLLLAVSSVVLLTALKARKQQQSLWHHQGQRLFSNLCLPLVAGGVFCYALLYHQLLYLIAPAMLIFYGLALINSSKYTFDDLRSLGIGQVVLGLLACFWVEYGLLAWAVGFGGLNILYGALLYSKYERVTA